MKNQLTLLATLPLIAFLAACGKEPTTQIQQPALPVEVAHPLEKSIVEFADFTGRLEAVEMVDVKPRVSGYIQSIHFKEGQKVKKGDLLFVIDPRPFDAQVKRFEALVNQEQAARALAQSNLARAEQLIASQSISQEEADIRRSEALQAEADLKAAEAELRAAALDLEFTQVTAPIDGIADRHFVTTGNLVTGDSTSLTTLVPHDPIYAYYEVDERSFLRGVRSYFEGDQPGRGSDTRIPAYLGLDDEEGFPREGVIDFASNQLDPDTATITVRALFENDDEFLTPGLFARIRVPITKEKSRILIPDTAIGTDQTIKYVWVLKADNTAERRSLSLGPKHESYRVVYSGLTTEDQIVTRGIQFIRPGVTLAPEMSEL